MANKIDPQDSPVHEWYRFVLSFPPHLVRTYLDRFELKSQHRVLDPFCGTGTTIVETKKQGVGAVGIEAMPMAYLASRSKTDWTPDPDDMLVHAERIARTTLEVFRVNGISDAPGMIAPDSHRLRTLPSATMKLLLKNSISPLPLHKTLVLLDSIESMREQAFDDHERVALAAALVGPIGNLHFGPEVGVSAPKQDAAVVGPWLSGVRKIADDLRSVHHLRDVPAVVHHADSRDVEAVVEPNSIDAVITSPPYPNEKDYSRTTRLESVILGLIGDKLELRSAKQDLVRSNTRSVYKVDTDDDWVVDHPEIQRIAEAIENRRIELGKTSGFERQYARVTKLYFGGMKRHLASLRTVLRPGAQLAYVVGDQASYLRVMIRTGQILADLAEQLGYEKVSIDLFRTRLATATKQQLREEVVVLRWPG